MLIGVDVLKLLVNYKNCAVKQVQVISTYEQTKENHNVNLFVFVDLKFHLVLEGYTVLSLAKGYSSWK